MYINIPSQYDIVSMAKRFHIGFYAKCKKCDGMYMCCICRHEEEAFEPPHDKTNKMTFVPSEDSDQPGHPPSLIRVSDQPGHPPSLIRVLAMRSLGSLGPKFADAQADLSLRWAHRSFCWVCHAVAQFSF